METTAKESTNICDSIFLARSVDIAVFPIPACAMSKALLGWSSMYFSTNSFCQGNSLKFGISSSMIGLSAAFVAKMDIGHMGENSRHPFLIRRLEKSYSARGIVNNIEVSKLVLDIGRVFSGSRQCMVR